MQAASLALNHAQGFTHITLIHEALAVAHTLDDLLCSNNERLYEAYSELHSLAQVCSRDTWWNTIDQGWIHIQAIGCTQQLGRTLFAPQAARRSPLSGMMLL